MATGLEALDPHHNLAGVYRWWDSAILQTILTTLEGKSKAEGKVEEKTPTEEKTIKFSTLVTREDSTAWNSPLQ